MNTLKHILLLALTIIAFSFSYGQSNLGTVCAESTEPYGVSGFSNSEFFWFVEENGGYIKEGQGNDTVFVEWGYNTGEYLIEVYELTIANCKGTEVQGQVTVQAPEVDLGYDTYEICDGDSMTFDATGDYDGNYTTEWFNGSFDPTYTATTSEEIWVKVTDQKGCVRYDTVEFTAHVLPEPDLGNDTVLCGVGSVLEYKVVDESGDAYAFYSWYSPINGELSEAPTYYAQYQPYNDSLIVDVTDYHGCSGSDTVFIETCGVEHLFLDMPNTFTPDGDGNNEKWPIYETDDWGVDMFTYMFPDAVLEIFDRWGRLVYHTEDIVGGSWDGTSKGRPMPMDSYFYVINLNYKDYESLSGSVNLVR